MKRYLNTTFGSITFFSLCGATSWAQWIGNGGGAGVGTSKVDVENRGAGVGRENAR